MMVRPPDYNIDDVMLLMNNSIVRHGIDTYNPYRHSINIICRFIFDNNINICRELTVAQIVRIIQNFTHDITDNGDVVDPMLIFTIAGIDFRYTIGNGLEGTWKTTTLWWNDKICSNSTIINRNYQIINLIKFMIFGYVS